MTRANIVIITRQGKFNFQCNSSAYPSNVMAIVLKFATSTASTNSGATNGFYDAPDSRELAEFIEDFGLTLGHVGNPSYFYDIDFVKQTVKVWDKKQRWVTAPADWKERGWNCYESKKGVFGWHTDIKGKLIYEKKFSELVNKVVNHEVFLNEGVVEEAINIAND
jgi:hypothetical protein